MFRPCCSPAGALRISAAHERPRDRAKDFKRDQVTPAGILAREHSRSAEPEWWGLQHGAAQRRPSRTDVAAPVIAHGSDEQRYSAISVNVALARQASTYWLFAPATGLAPAYSYRHTGHDHFADGGVAVFLKRPIQAPAQGQTQGSGLASVRMKSFTAPMKHCWI